MMTCWNDAPGMSQKEMNQDGRYPTGLGKWKKSLLAKKRNGAARARFEFWEGK